jgi:hydrogenase-4 component B
MNRQPPENTQLLSLAPLTTVGWMGFVLLAAVGGVAVLYALLLRRSPVASAPTWGCGYAAPTRRMQYTASSFAALLVALFDWALRSSRQRPRNLPLFPSPRERFHSEVPDAVLDRGVLPVFRFGAGLCTRLRVFQQGQIQLYLLYIFVILVLLLLWR